MAQSASIQLRNDLSELAALGAFVESFAADHGLGTDVTYKINCALDELVTNIISYGFTDNETHLIDISLTIDAHEVRAELSDDGKDFNPVDADEPDVNAPLDQRQPGGLGIYLVKRLMDSVEYNRVGARNTIKLVKRL